MQKRKNGYPNSGYPYPTRISGYLPGSTCSVSDPNSKLYYPGITRIRPEYKNICICIRKMVPNQYPYPVPVSGTLPVFTPREKERDWARPLTGLISLVSFPSRNCRAAGASTSYVLIT
jgi:hypothetical protein